MSAVTYLEAIGQAIREEMQRDEAVFLLGEDVGTYGGAFKVSAGLLEDYKHALDARSWPSCSFWCYCIGLVRDLGQRSPQIL